MSNTKKSTSKILLILIVLSVCFVGYITLQDFFKTPGEKIVLAQQKIAEGKPKQAERLLKMALNTTNENEEREASYLLGLLYATGGNGLPINGRWAEMYLEKAALMGEIEAAYQLALMYDVGTKIPENRVKAISWMMRAAQQGYAPAEYGLGVWAEREYLGPVQMDKVVALYTRAAEKGHTNAMRSLIAIYTGGFGGFPRNLEQAVYWTRQLEKTEE